MGAIQDRAFFEWLAKHDPDIKTVFDVGAHVGKWSAQFAEVFPEATFHLFEPRLAFDEEINQECRQNAQNYKHRIIEDAVGRTRGTAQFSVQGHRGVGSSLLLPREVRDEKIVDVNVTTIDDYVEEQQIDRIDFLKMDIQGGELAALRGRTRRSRKQNICFSRPGSFQATGIRRRTCSKCSTISESTESSRLISSGAIATVATECCFTSMSFTSTRIYPFCQNIFIAPSMSAWLSRRPGASPIKAKVVRWCRR
ncbi:MAG: FkbM family methyltransferase [Oceanicaulis sp.]